MNEGKYEEAQKAFQNIYGYKDSKEKVTECMNKALDQEYEEAMQLLEAGQYDEAAYAFKVLGGHKDSVQKKEEAMLAQKRAELKTLSVGDSVKLGRYAYNDIEWQVLDAKDGKLLLISTNAIDAARYSERHTELSWETSDIRKWLNDNFLNEVFTEAEKGIISKTVLTDMETEDQIYLLSVEEAEHYFPAKEDRICKATSRAISSKVDRNYGTSACTWWLRTLRDGSTAIVVEKDGEIMKNGYGVFDDDNGIRPVMWITIE